MADSRHLISVWQLIWIMHTVDSVEVCSEAHVMWTSTNQPLTWDKHLSRFRYHSSLIPNLPANSTVWCNCAIHVWISRKHRIVTVCHVQPLDSDPTGIYDLTPAIIRTAVFSAVFLYNWLGARFFCLELAIWVILDKCNCRWCTLTNFGVFLKVLLHFKIKRDKALDSGQRFSVLVVFFRQLWHWMRLSVRGKWGVAVLFFWFIVRRSWASETGSLAEAVELVDLALGPHCIGSGPASAEEAERRFVFHRISVVHTKQCLSIDSFCACGHRFLPIYIFFVLSFFSSSWGVP